MFRQRQRHIMIEHQMRSRETTQRRAHPDFCATTFGLSKIGSTRLRNRIPIISTPAGAPRHGVLMKRRHFAPSLPSDQPPVVKRVRRSTRPPRRPSSAARDPIEFATVLDLVRYAVTRFNEGEARVRPRHHRSGRRSGLPGRRGAAPAARSLRMVRACAGAPRPERERILGLIEARIRTRKPAAYLLGRIYAAGVAVPRRRARDRAALLSRRDHRRRCLLPAARPASPWTGPRRGRRGCSTSAPDRVRSPCSRRCGFPMPRSMPSTFRRMRSKLRHKMSREHGLGDRITLLRGDLFAPVGGRALRPHHHQSALCGRRRHGGAAAGVPARAGAGARRRPPTVSPSSRASSRRPAAT